ncbi:hypothetical protein HCA61_07725 [Rhodococcus sp. HNM0563]|uniref:hypothetical protein n=1 Tax=unclassified Rhodococcus (in: high G+C Gram-positive bacteria) TaxID=192944 RepID=UPI00146D96FC|nr:MULTISPECIES: hypothetical protein [unclassified Rhodococcus (in: high G+C Gram-positive bacteria)]MCK0089898.1 hypothetical protein [Rhodococcus sp. F64268]NLU62153.1 hypothetical protein [Rhodococcus sp. HNM0563]
MPTLDSVADSLYGLDPGEFIAARTEYVAQARESGDRELTAAIGRLRKPTVAAWLVNLLARERPDELGVLLDLGDALRTAQRTLSGQDLRTLSTQRRQVISALERDAAELASERGRTASDSALREVAQTLNAALADPAVAERVRAGRLDAIVEPSGIGALGDLGGSSSTPTLSVVPDRSAARTDGAEGRAELAEATTAAHEARRAVTRARAAAQEADRELARHEAEVAALQEKLVHAEQQRKFARRAVAAAKKDVTAAEREASAAEADVVRIERRYSPG